MVTTPTSCFLATSTVQKGAAGKIISALLASEMQTNMQPEAEGGRVRSPPQRDKQNKFNLGASLQEQDQLRVIAMLNANSDRFAFGMEDLDLAEYSGEPMRLELT